MSAPHPDEPARLTEPLPAGARLLHLGLPKTGTTALQTTARARRADLLGGRRPLPRRRGQPPRGGSALMGRRWGWIGPGAAVPPLRHWERLVAEVRAETERRVWISHEFASEADDAAVARFVEELGEPLQVVGPLRPSGAVLVSSWQQYLKGGRTHTFQRWLRAVLVDPPELKVTPSFHLRADQTGGGRVVGGRRGSRPRDGRRRRQGPADQLTDAFRRCWSCRPASWSTPRWAACRPTARCRCPSRS